MKRVIIILLLLSFTAFQTNFASGGSLYTRYGVGDIFHYYSARHMSLGGGGYSLITNGVLDPINPASWSGLKFTRFNLAIIYDGMNLANNNQTRFYSTTKFSGFNLGFPLERDLGLSFVMGLLPVSNVEYEVKEQSSNNEIDSPKFTYQGDGSINKVYIGFSYKLPLDFRLGATFEYYTGDIKYTSSMIFENSTSFSNATFNKELSYRGIGSTIGLISGDLSQMFKGSFISNWRVGFSLIISPKINTDTSETSITKIGSNKTESATVTTDLPLKIGIGTSFILNKNYLILLDYVYQPWSNFKFNNKSENNLRDLSRLSIGFEYHNSDANKNSFWEQIKLRGGLSYEQTQYKIFGEGIDEYSFYGGFSIPIGSISEIDIGLSYGTRGTKNLNLIQENFIRTNVSLNFGELWFVRRER